MQVWNSKVYIKQHGMWAMLLWKQNITETENMNLGREKSWGFEDMGLQVIGVSLLDKNRTNKEILQQLSIK